MLCGVDVTGTYTARLAAEAPDRWDGIVSQFADVNLFQLAAWEGVRGSAGRDVVHMTLADDKGIVTAAQVRLVRLAGTGLGAAYARWGPLWRPASGEADPQVFRQAIRALRRELSIGRGLVLRIYPYAFRGSDSALEAILLEEGFRLCPGRVERTLIIDLDIPLDALRAGLDQKWRNRLNRAEKNGLDVEISDDDAFFDKVAALYGDLVRRKRIVELTDIEHLREVNRSLVGPVKLKSVLCRQGGVLVAAAVFSAIGETGQYLIGATSDEGLKSCGSYLVQWRILCWLKENGFVAYDLNGINPDANPGTYHFKSGLAGKNGRDVELLGRFEAQDHPVLRMAVHGGEAALRGLARARRVLSRVFARWQPGREGA